MQVQKLHLNGSLKAISHSPDYNLIAVGGSNVFRILQYDDEKRKFSFVRNLRVGKVNRDLNVNDLKWHPSPSHKHLIASAPTNARVILWNLERQNPLEKKFVEHERTVNRVCWSKSEPNLLLAGSQEGTVRMWDIRESQTHKIFQCDGEVRDLQISPFHSNFMACGTQNGTIQMWDLRFPKKCKISFNAHHQFVLCVQWHPRNPMWLASGGRDRTVKIWDWNSPEKLKPLCLIQTIATVSRLSWRPNHDFEFATCSSESDFAVNVWNMNQPFLPKLVYRSHSDIVTGFFWQNNNSNDIVSCSRDQYVAFQPFSTAEQPQKTVRTVTCEWNNKNQISFVSDPVDRTLDLPNSDNEQNGAVPRSYPPVSISYSKIYRSGPGVADADDIKNSPESNFHYYAKNFAFYDNNLTLADKLVKNSSVAEKIDDFPIKTVWDMLKQILIDQQLFLTRPEPVKEHPAKSEIEQKNGQKSQLFDLEKEDSEDEGEFMIPSVSVPQSPEGAENPGEDDDLQVNLHINMKNLIFEQEESDSDVDSYDYQFPMDDLSPSNHVDQKPMNTSPPKKNLEISDVANVRSDVLPKDLFLNVIEDIINYYSNEGNIQMCVALCAVLLPGTDNGPTEPPKIDETRILQWIIGYIEQLQSRKLWSEAAYLAKSCPYHHIHQEFMKNNSFQMACRECQKSITGNSSTCEKCKKTIVCMICHETIRGHFICCHKCGSVGHLSCIWSWSNTQNCNCPICHKSFGLEAD